MHRLFLVSLIVLAFSRPLFGQGGPGQSNYPISQQTGTGVPSGTCPGTNVYYLDLPGGTIYTCPVPGGSWTASAQGGGFPITGPVTVNTNGSIAPSGIGQIFSNQTLAPDFNAQAPSVTVSGTGGSLIGGHGGVFAYTYTNDGTHETLPSATLQASYTVLNAACSGSTCTATIVSPAAYSGFTGWNAYYLDYSTYTGQTPEKVAACTNVAIGTNCTITSAVSGGASPPTLASVPLQPANAQATTCAPQVNPIFLWAQDSNGNYDTSAGINPAIDLAGATLRTAPTITYCTPVFFDDMAQNSPYGGNTFVGIFHRAGNNTSLSGQERALAINYQFGSSSSPSSATAFAAEAQQTELDFYCASCDIDGNPDGEVTAGSFQTGDFHTGTIAAPIVGVNAIRAENFREGGAGTYTGTVPPWSAVRAIMDNNSSVAAGSAYMDAIDALVEDGSGAASGLNAVDVWAHTPSSTFTGAYEMRADDSGSGSGFYNFYSNAGNEEQGKNSFLGKTGLEHVVSAQPQNGFSVATCAVTGAGSGATCAVGSQAADSMGTMTITTASSGTAGTGTVTLTYHKAFASPQATTHCLMMPENGSSGTWNGLATIVGTTPSLSSYVATWTNGTTPTALTASETYNINYWCWGN